ncbi:MAG: hypothetical protein JNK53_02720, partial [Phycisphaerae bacterium]|nr:hypothetical protein [Phycisphaerae bacterium]
EYSSLALVLPERESPVLTRELIYTALTRWKAGGIARGGAGGGAAGGASVGAGVGTGVTIIASAEVLASALGAHVQRASGLAERIERAAAVEAPESRVAPASRKPSS